MSLPRQDAETTAQDLQQLRSTRKPSIATAVFVIAVTSAIAAAMSGALTADDKDPPARAQAAPEVPGDVQVPKGVQ